MDCGNGFQFKENSDWFQFWYGLRGPAGPAGAGVQLRGPVASTSELPGSAPSGELWLVGASSPYDGYFWNGSAWENAGPIVRGPAGKSAYESAQDGGYTGTEQQFNSDLASVPDKLDKTGDGKDVTVTFNAAESRTNISTGEKLSVLFGKIAKFFTDLGTAAFRAATSSITQNSTDLVESGAVYSALNTTQSDIAIILQDPAQATIASGKYVIYNNVVYKTKASIPSGTAASTYSNGTYWDACPDGGFNSVNDSLSSLNNVAVKREVIQWQDTYSPQYTMALDNGSYLVLVDGMNRDNANWTDLYIVGINVKYNSHVVPIHQATNHIANISVASGGILTIAPQTNWSFVSVMKIGTYY